MRNLPILRNRYWSLLMFFIFSVEVFTVSAQNGSQERGESKAVMKGLFASIGDPEPQEQFDELADRIRLNPHLSGVLIGERWNALEPAEGGYDFSTLDRRVSVARKAKKPYKLKITPGGSSPDYLYTAGVQRIETTVSNPNRSNFGDPISVPIPWDPIYQGHFSRLIEALGKRYSSDPYCIAVTLTCANFLSAEMHLPDDRESMRQWAQVGLTPDKLLAVYKKYLGEWAAAFPRQLVCLHMSKSVDFSGITEHEFAERIVIYAMEAFPEQFALQNNGLHGRKEDIRAAQAENPIMKYKDTRLLNGLQSFASFNGNPIRQGSVQMAVLNYVYTESEYWEMGALDGLDLPTCREIMVEIEEARRLGYEGYRDLLKEVGLYRTGENDVWPTVADQMRKDKTGKSKLRELRRTIGGA